MPSLETPVSPTTELYLAFEIDGAKASSASEAVLRAALAAVPVSSLLLRAKGGAALTAQAAKPLVELAQKRGVAALIAADCALARIVKADGVHVPWSKTIVADFKAARGELGERYIVGADAGRSRHEAMEMGEAGADYIAFGIPPHVEDRSTAEDRQIDLVAWWSEIFEIPCVAGDVAAPAHARDLAFAGADFVSVTLSDDMTAADAVTQMEAMRAALNDAANVGTPA